MKLALSIFLCMVSATAFAGEAPIFVKPKVKSEGDVAFTEGPAWHPSGNVYFSDIRNNRIMRRDRNGQIHVFRTPSGYSNGLAFDHQGRLVACEGGGAPSNRRVTRTELDGTITVLASHYQGKRINSPNDLTIDSQGRIYFSDPRYRDRTGLEQFDKQGRAIEGVYRIDPDGTINRIITHEVDRPNGLAVSTDDRWLFVADNNNDKAGNNRKLWRFDLDRRGFVEPKSRKLLFDWGTERGPDGMTIDAEYRLYVTAGFNHSDTAAQTANLYKAGVYVISHEGKLLDFLAVPADMITNCCFGGNDGKTLFITAGQKLWSMPTNTRGHIIYRGESKKGD